MSDRDVIHIVKTNRADWMKWRTQDVTASDIAAIMGVHPSKSPLQVWLEKTGRAPPDKDNPTLQRGRWMEAAIHEALSEQRPDWQITRSDVYLRDQSIGFGATPDATAIDPNRPGFGYIEYKSVRDDIFERDWINGLPPLHYRVQALATAHLLDADWVAIAAIVMRFSGEFELVVCEIKRRPEIEQRFRDAVQSFWAAASAGTAPAPMFALDDEAIALLYPEAKKPESMPLDLKANNMLPELLDKLDAIKKRQKEDKADREKYEVEIKSILGEHSLAVARDGSVIKWKNEPRKGYFVEASSPRVLRITRPKGI